MSRHIDDFDQLKQCVLKYLNEYVQDHTSKDTEIDPDIKKEYENQRAYLESSVHSLHKRLEQEQMIHKEEHLHIMEQNIKLIEQIGDLRREVNRLNSVIKSNKPKKDSALEDIDAPLEPARKQVTDEEEELGHLRRQAEQRAQYVKALQGSL